MTRISLERNHLHLNAIHRQYKIKFLTCHQLMQTAMTRWVFNQKMSGDELLLAVRQAAVTLNNDANELLSRIRYKKTTNNRTLCCV